MMSQDENLQEQLWDILEMTMTDFTEIINHDDEDYMGNKDTQMVIVNALMNDNIRNAFIYQFTDDCTLDIVNTVANELGMNKDLDPLDLAQACSTGRMKSANYLSYILDNLSLPAHDESILTSTISTLALLDGQWEPALIGFINAVKQDKDNEFAKTMLHKVSLLTDDAPAFITEVFRKHTQLDLLAGSSLL